MKKIFQIGLLMLLYIVTLAVVPEKTGPTHLDSGIMANYSPDQPVLCIQDQPVEIMPIFSIPGNYNPSYLVALRHGDVEKSSSLISNSDLLKQSQGKMKLLYSDMSTSYMEPTSLMGLSRQPYRGQYRLDIGENFFLCLVKEDTYRQPRDGFSKS